MDRGGVDHGGINQMLAGISAHRAAYRAGARKMALRVCASCLAAGAVGAIGTPARALPVVTFVDRQMSGNRRFDHTLSRELVYLLATSFPW